MSSCEKYNPMTLQKKFHAVQIPVAINKLGFVKNKNAHIIMVLKSRGILKFKPFQFQMIASFISGPLCRFLPPKELQYSDERI